ncbi:transmembrane protease serine 11B-like protein [Brevipalpus obovatus]|uniref:transmembrane protease serine 11B-like protein n=1 Tax=Brevipalpus obovatus TaxID=246614 RepID=UPI003D9F63B9
MIDGKTPPPAGKIKNGKTAQKNEFPYIVALLGAGQHPKQELFGAGTLLSDRWIVTSKLAALDQKGNGHKLKDLVVSPAYDIDLSMLLKLNESIPIGNDSDSLIKPISIGSQPERVQDAYIAGWGVNSKKNTSDEHKLQYGRITLINTGCLLTCKIMIRTKLGSYPQVCRGDIGGPAVQRDGKNPDTLVGVISSHDNLCLSMNVFVNATTYRPWIEETMREDPGQSTCRGSGWG